MMKKPTVSLLGIALLLFAFSAPAVYAQVECDNDADCEDGLFCTVNSCSNDGSVCIIVGTPCEASETCDEESDSCVECITDNNCTQDAPYCVENVCVECRNGDDCFDFNVCNGIESCVDGACEEGVPPCGEQACIDLGDGAYTCVGCDNDTQCDDGLYCNGAETCNETIGECEQGIPVDCKGWYCDEDNDTCVECLVDRHCDDEEFCNGQETCNETSGRCEDGEEPCEEPLICDNETESCVECLTDRDCGDSDTPYCDNETLSCVECLFDDDCDSSEIGPYCDDESLSCVECIDDADCEDNETCREGVCGVAACDLKIRPKKVRVGRMFRPIQRRFKITSEEGYVPGETINIDFGWLQPYVKKYQVTKKGKLKVWVRVPTGARLFKGPLEVIVNDCVAEVLFK